MECWQNACFAWGACGEIETLLCLGPIRGLATGIPVGCTSALSGAIQALGGVVHAFIS